MQLKIKRAIGARPIALLKKRILDSFPTAELPASGPLGHGKSPESQPTVYGPPASSVMISHRERKVKYNIVVLCD